METMTRQQAIQLAKALKSRVLVCQDDRVVAFWSHEILAFVSGQPETPRAVYQVERTLS